MASIGTKHRRQKRRGSGRKFIQLWGNVKRSAAYHGLSLPARCALVELLDRFNGVNNGMIGLGVRELSAELRCSQGTAAGALRELDDAGLVSPVTGGKWKGKRATEWRVNFYKCDATGDLPVRSWPAAVLVFSEESTKVQPRKHKGDKCSATKAHKPKNPITDPSKCSATDTHVYIYQGEQELGKRREWTKPAVVDEGPRREKRRRRAASA